MPKKILVVDDDFTQRDIYFELFRSAGYETTFALDGQDAWEKIQKSKPDLLFTAILMPRMTGFELIQKMRDGKATCDIPIVVFSHLSREEDRQKSASFGVDFKVKGYDGPGDILKSVKILLEPSSRQVKRVDPIDDDRPGIPMF